MPTSLTISRFDIDYSEPCESKRKGINLLKFFKTDTIIDDVFLWIGKMAIVVTLLFGFTALTSYNVANGQIEEAVRTKREELKEEETEESIKERKRRSTKWISDNQYLRIYCHDNRIDTFTVLVQSN